MNGDVVHIRDYLPTFEVVHPHEDAAEVIILPMLRMEREAMRRYYRERASRKRSDES